MRVQAYKTSMLQYFITVKAISGGMKKCQAATLGAISPRLFHIFASLKVKISLRCWSSCVQKTMTLTSKDMVCTARWILILIYASTSLNNNTKALEGSKPWHTYPWKDSITFGPPSDQTRFGRILVRFFWFNSNHSYSHTDDTANRSSLVFVGTSLWPRFEPTFSSRETPLTDWMLVWCLLALLTLWHWKQLCKWWHLWTKVAPILGFFSYW